MEVLEERSRAAFPKSRKLASFEPTADQLTNVAFRLRQLYTDEQLAEMDERVFVRQVERVWPIARYVDRADGRPSIAQRC